MATDPELTFDDVQGCLTYMTHYRAARSSVGLDRVEKERILRFHKIEIAKTMTPSFFHSLLNPRVDGPTFDALIADLLDTPLRDPRVSFDVRDPRSHSELAIRPRILASSVEQADTEQHCSEAICDDLDQCDQDDKPDLPSDCDAESESRRDTEATSNFQAQGAEMSIKARMKWRKSKRGYSPAPIADVTCTMCGKRLPCRSKVC